MINLKISFQHKNVIIKTTFASKEIGLKYSGIIYMLVASVCFTLVNTCVKFLHHIPAHELVFFRSAISFIICLYFITRYNLPFLGNNKKWLVLRGLFGCFSLVLFFITIKNLPLASATTIQYLSPIFTIIIALFLFKEVVKPIQWLFFAIALLGCFLIKGFNNDISFAYIFLGLLSACLSGVAYNAIKMCANTDHTITIVIYFPMIALPIMGVWCLFDWVMPVGKDWLFLIIMGIFVQIAQVCMTKALTSSATSLVMPLKYLGAIYAFLVGLFLFDERLEWISIAGILLVIFGVLTNTLIRRKIVG